MKRIISMIVIVSLLASILFAVVSISSAETRGDVWDGSTTEPTRIVSKDSILYYEITKCSELAFVAQEGGDWLEKSYILGNNLIFNDVEITVDNFGICTNSEDLKRWTPIGNESKHFHGKFLGNGYTISGLFCTGDDCVGLVGIYSGTLIDGITMKNSYVNGNAAVGGVVGRIFTDGGCIIQNCSFEGTIKGNEYVGGVCGQFYYSCSNYIEHCDNYGNVFGATLVGGVTGTTQYANYCNNYGNVAGTSKVGGIAGSVSLTSVMYCQNFGSVTGESDVGGISGSESFRGYIHYSMNAGTVSGKNNIGGIVGFASNVSGYPANISNSYNTGAIIGESYIGGISGNLNKNNIVNCYNVGDITGTSFVGGVAGSAEAIWGNGTVENCYYCSEGNSGISGFGNYTADDLAGLTSGLNKQQLKTESTYQAWDFDYYWAISSDKNGGYPYLQWQEDTLGDIPVNGVSLSKSTLELKQGDKVYLTAIISPTNATIKTCTWTSSDPTVASVDDNGKVVALSAGTATITVTTTDGGFSATCDVTVTARSIEEYAVDKYDLNGDGVVNAADLTELARVVAKIDTVQYG